MALTVSFVDQLQGIVEPVQQYLQRDLHVRDEFAPQVLVVPTIGVRSWLTPLLASTLGSTDGRRDGIFANVNVQYVGYLHRMLREAAGLSTDPWERNRVNLATLQALNGFSKTPQLEKKYNGRLNAARILAERFDRYATRRPELIRSWHRGMSALGDLSEEKFHWQFQLWQRVRDIVGATPWPVINAELCDRMRKGERIPGIPDRLMIAGFETISPSNMEIISALSVVIDVEVVFVHQSPYLREQWNNMASGVVPNADELPLPSQFEPLTASSLRLPPAWMQSSFDLELLLAAYGISAEFIQRDGRSSSTILRALQRGISDAPSVVNEHLKTDSSVQIHRAHNLARQVEVLHDALLHAFDEDENLQPHDVVVLCADIQNAAPILEAVFDKTVVTSSGREFRLPLVVADRTLKDINNGADLATNVLKLVASRFDLESFIMVATSPLVMKNFGISASDVAVWGRHLGNTRLRWGLDAEHREQHGLVAPTLNAHGWIESLERSIMGAMMAVAADAPVMAGGIRPVPFVESSDIGALTTLIGVLSVVAHFEQQSRQQRSIDEWCLETEIALQGLCGESSADLDDVYNVLNSFQRASNSLGSASNSDAQLVPFSEFADYVTGELTAVSGRLPLRSGSITATSFVPLRTVPFKVVCIVGFDDGTLPMGEPEGDDLVAATPMLGDGDAKVESRRIFLDALMAAEDTFIVTCTGRSIKNNKLVPLITPLSEFLDFCKECGVDVSDEDENLCTIEYSHPRHLGSPQNFQMEKGPVAGKIWSHDTAGLLAAIERVTVRASSEGVTNGAVNTIVLPEALKEITLSQLETLVIDPLRHFLETGLKIRKQWDKEDVSNVLPLFVEGNSVSRMCREAFYQNLSDDQLQSLLYSSDVLPIAPFDEKEVTAAIDLVNAYRTAYQQDLPSPAQSVNIDLRAEGLPTLTGSVEGYHSEEATLGYVTFSKGSPSDFSRIVVRVLAVIASGLPLEKAFLYELSTGKSSTLRRTIEIDEAITPDIALDKLMQLLAVEPIGRSYACPLFGSAAEILFAAGTPTDDVRDDAEDAFDSFVGDERGYPRSYELMVYGASPECDEVYADASGVLGTFFTAYFHLRKSVDVKHKGKNGWRLVK